MGNDQSEVAVARVPDVVQGQPEPGVNWDYAIRENVVEQVLHAILHGYGAVLEGEPGSGKAAVAASVLRKLRHSAHVIQMDGDDSGQNSHGFGSLLANLPATDDEARTTVIESIRKELFRASGGLQIVVYVPDSLMLSESAISMLASLTLSGTISLLTISRNSQRDLLSGLMHAVHLERIYLEPLSLEETRVMLRLALGAEPSRAAAFALWTGVAGHRRLLEALTRDWLGSGFLHEVQGVWVISGLDLPVGDRTRRAWQELLSNLGVAQREIVEFLALARRMPLHQLLSIFAVEDIDIVHDLGFLEFGRGHVRVVKLRGSVASAAITSHVSPGRAAALLNRMRQNTTAPWPVSVTSLYEWEVAAGLRPTPELAIDAAETALEQGDGAGALGFLSGVSEFGEGPRYLNVYLRALSSCGHLERALEVIGQYGLNHWKIDDDGNNDEVVSRLAAHLDSTHQFNLAWTSLQIFALSHQVADELLFAILERLLGRIEVAIGKDGQPFNGLGEPAASASLRLLEQASWRGKPHYCAEMQYSIPVLDGSELWLWQVLQNSNAVLRGEVRLGIQRGRELTLLVHQTESSGQQRLATRIHLFGLYLLAGEWAEAAEVIDGSWVGGRESRRLDDASDLYAGIVLALQDEPAEAIARLHDELVQRKLSDPEGLYAMGLAAAAFASAAVGNVEEAANYLFEVDDAQAQQVGASALTTSAVAYFRALTDAELGNRTVALENLMQVASADHAAGRTSFEILVLAEASGMGHLPAVELLLERATESSGRLAAVCRIYAQAVLAGDDDALRAVARSFDLLGHPRMAERIRASAPRRGEGRIKTTSRQVATRRQTGSSPNPFIEQREQTIHTGVTVPRLSTSSLDGAGAGVGVDAGPLPLPLLASLTARQQDTVRLAAEGQSNKEIANHLGLSVRTVESHLYQIYSRLGVSGRSDLADLLGEPGKQSI